MTRRLTLVAHCLLDPLTRPHGLAAPPRPGLDGPVYQLPCPELSYLGPRRWEVSREQLDFPGYRRHCRGLARRVAEDVANLAATGVVDIRLLGVPGSPSCAAETTTVGYPGGRLERSEHAHVGGMGVFVQELTAQLATLGVEVQAADAPARPCGPGCGGDAKA